VAAWIGFDLMQGTYDNPGPECGRPPTQLGPGTTRYKSRRYAWKQNPTWRCDSRCAPASAGLAQRWPSWPRRLKMPHRRLPDGGSGAARNQVRAAGTGPDRLPGRRPRATRSGDDHGQLRRHRRCLGGSRARPVLPDAGVVLPADPPQPAGHRRLRSAPPRSASAVGVLCPGASPDPGRGWLPAGGAAGDGGRWSHGAVLCRHQTRQNQRAHPGPHYGQVRGLRRLSNRGARTGCRGGPGPGRPALGD